MDSRGGTCRPVSRGRGAEVSLWLGVGCSVIAGGPGRGRTPVLAGWRLVPMDRIGPWGEDMEEAAKQMQSLYSLPRGCLVDPPSLPGPRSQPDLCVPLPLRPWAQRGQE